MSLVAPLVKSLVSPLVVSLLGGGAISAEAALDAALEAEATSGDFVAQPDLTDLTSIFQADGSGNPSVGDSIADATVLDTSQFGGKTAAAFIAGQPELVESFSLYTSGFGQTGSSDGTISYVDGTLTIVRNTTDAFGWLDQAVESGETYEIEFTLGASSATTSMRFGDDVATGLTAGNTYSYIYEATSNGLRFWPQSTGTSAVITSVSVKHLPGNHTTATGTGPTVAGANTTERGPELVTNGTFDTDISGWDAQNGASLSHGAGTIQVLRATSYTDTARVAVTCEIGDVLEVKVDVVSVGNSSERVHFSDLSAMPTVGNVSDDDGVGSRKVQVIATATTMYLHLGCRGNSQTCEFDNISVKKVIQLPVISTNGTDDKLTLPLPARRNLLTWTEDFSQSDWTTQGATSTGQAVTAATGTVVPLHYQASTPANSTTHALRFNVSSTEVDYIQVSVNGSTAYWANYDLTDGTVGTTNGSGTYEISDNGDGSYQITFVYTTAGTNHYPVIGFVDSKTASRRQSATWAGESATITEVQLEVASTATDYQRITSDHLADTSITMAVRTSDTDFILVNPDGSLGSPYLLAIEDGSSATALSAGSGTPSYRLDGAAWSPSTRDDLHTDLADGDWHIVTISAADLSDYGSLIFGDHPTYAGYELAGDIAAISIYPDSTATRDLAEAAAAKAIEDTGYALA